MASEEIHVIALPAVLDELEEYLHGREISEVVDYSGPLSRRDMVEHILVYQALTLGGINKKQIKVSPWPGVSYKRMLTLLKSGTATLFSNTIWREDILQDHPQIAVSSETLGYGENIAGLYMNPSNPKYFSELVVHELTAVSSPQWKPDWNALRSIPLKHIYGAVNWESMVKMVDTQRADFMLIPFTTKADFSINTIGVNLKPKKGVKIALEGTRGWAVSKTHPAGKLALDALEKGLLILNSNGALKKAYEQAGTLNRKVTHWKTLNNTPH